MRSKGYEGINVVIESPWKRVLIAGMAIVALVAATEIIGNFIVKRGGVNLNEINLSPVKSLLDNQNIFYIIPVAVILIIVIILISSLIRHHNRSKKLARIDDSNIDVKELYKQERKIKKELEAIKHKSLMLAKKSKEEKARNHHKENRHMIKSPIKDKKDIKKVLKMVDNLLGKLPDDEIEKFAKTKEAKVYKAILKKYGAR